MSQRISDYEGNSSKSNRSSMQPLLLALVLLVGILLGVTISGGEFGTMSSSSPENPNKLVQIINEIDANYVDSVERKVLVDGAINSILENLDPHSYYISSEEYQSVKERMQGNFEGIGVEFIIQEDTLRVVTALPGGPSEKAGILPGDKIITVEGESITGEVLTSEFVMEKLKGPKGSKVNLAILRTGETDLLDFELKRDRIPIHSVVASFMVAPNIGYVKVSQFAATTYREFFEDVVDLREEGAKSLIMDLRGNTGGYLDQATNMIQEFLDEDKLMVYTEGRTSPRQMDFSRKKGKFRNMEVVILLNQGSASASEVVAGALQDWDRALTVGRRSFGKGLVQNEFNLGDESAIRLTVARYYTPTGRCIQKPYGEDVDYGSDYHDRYSSGELMSADSIAYDEEFKYTTPAGRVVYGGGGITPDVFVPIDTVGASGYLNELSYNGLLREYGFIYSNANRKDLEKIANVETFTKLWEADDEFLNAFTTYAEKREVDYIDRDFQSSKDVIAERLKAYVARNIFENEAFYFVELQSDKDFLEALRVAQDYKDVFASLLGEGEALSQLAE